MASRAVVFIKCHTEPFLGWLKDVFSDTPGQILTWKYVLSVKNEKKASGEEVGSKAESSHFQQGKGKTHQWWKMIMWGSQTTWAWTPFEAILGKDLPETSEKKAVSFWILFVKKIHGLYIYETKPLITI